MVFQKPVGKTLLVRKLPGWIGFLIHLKSWGIHLESTRGSVLSLEVISTESEVTRPSTGRSTVASGGVKKGFEANNPIFGVLTGRYFCPVNLSFFTPSPHPHVPTGATMLALALLFGIGILFGAGRDASGKKR